MAAPVISDFGDDDHSGGDSGLTIDGFQFGHFLGEAWIFANSDGTGLSDQLTIAGGQADWTDMQITNVSIPASPNNLSGMRYLFVKDDGDVWSLPYAFTLTSTSTTIGAPGSVANWQAFLPHSAALTPMTDGAISGTGTVVLQGSHQTAGGLGAVLITADDTNDATVVIRKNNASGEIVFDMATARAQYISQNIRVDDTSVLYYSVTGTGAQAMLYEYHR